MADVIMPQMGESIAEGTVTKWLKNVGARVERDEPLFEISTDKVDAEIPSPAAGVLREIRVPPGTTVPINTVVAVIAEEASAQAPAVAAAPPAPPSPAPLPMAAPPPPEGRDRPAPQAGPAPPTAEAPPSTPPPVAYHIEDEPAAEDNPFPAPPAPPRAPAAGEERSADELRLSRSSPVVRKIAAEHHLDIREVPGTGIGGRVTKQDILTHIDGRREAATEPLVERPSTAGAAPPLPEAKPSDGPASSSPLRPSPGPIDTPIPSSPAAPAPGRVEIVPMSPIRRKTAEHMLLSRRTSAHVTTVFEIDMTRVGQLRAKHEGTYEARGVRLTWMPFILKAVVDALKAHPVVNASIDGTNVVYHRDVNLGLAVALDWGLIVPVIRNAEEKNVLGLARAASDLAERARTRKLKVDEVQGGTFTVTNPGGFGSLFGTPIINQPQVAILDVGVIEKRPVVREDAIAIRTMAYFALTFDHRLVDGADADRFMAHLKRTLQEFDESSL